jgi:hypothetical protein
VQQVTEAVQQVSGTVQQLRQYSRSRLSLLVFSAACGISLALCSSKSVTQDVDGLRSALGERVAGPVGSLVWEPSSGIFGDFLVGRPLQFEARVRQGTTLAPRDIYRTLIRLSPEGNILSIAAPHNITHTSKSDESGLIGNQWLSGWVAQSHTSPSSISLIRFNSKVRRASDSWAGQVQLGLSRLLATGSWSGLDQIDIIAPSAQAHMSLDLKDKELQLRTRVEDDWFEQSIPLEQWAHVEQIANRSPTQDATPNFEKPRWIHREQRAIAWSHFGANLLRQMFGSTWVARLESVLFTVRDGILRTGYGWSYGGARPQPSIPAPKQPPLSPLQKASNWPPSDLVRAEGHKGDGAWSPWNSSLLPPGEAPLFYRTLLHPDLSRPYAELHLVAFDMRRLRLGMRAGYEDPEPESGPPGSGHGMKAEGRVISSPVVGAATVRIDNTGQIGMGTWRATDDVENTIEFRQNLDPLVAKGQVNPEGRTSWGEHVDATGVAIERSALCLHESGHLIYAWATEATGQSLAEGLRQAGCIYSMHLDMNPGHCTFAINRIHSLDPLNAQGEVLDPRMKVNAIRYVKWSPKDFFYLAKRDGTRGISERQLGLSFTPDGGQQPSPRQIPGIFGARQTLGPLTLEIIRIDPNRVAFQMIPGAAERGPQRSLIAEPAHAPHLSALIAFGLGHQTLGSRPGLSIDQQVIVPLSLAFGTLVLQEDSSLQILGPGTPLIEKKGLAYLQLPALARDGALLPSAKELGGSRLRQALCLDPGGTFYWGRVEHDSIAPLVQRLIDLGCTLVLEAERGSHSPSYQARAGTDRIPEMGWAQTVLYALSQEMTPSTYQF